MGKIIVSTVCYDNENEVIEFAKNLSTQEDIGKICLLITCNKCSEPEKLRMRLRCLKLETIVYVPNKNLGYLQGCLYGIKKYAEKNDYIWALICNTDILFGLNTFFKDVFRNQIEKDIWCIAPDIILKNTNEHQNPFYMSRLSKNKIQILRIMYSTFFSFRVYSFLAKSKNYFMKKQTYQPESTYIYSAHGSCFFLNKECIDKLYYQNGIFMYCEELLISEVILENKKKVYLNSDVKIIHNENQVTGEIKSVNKWKWFKESIEFIYSRFYTSK